MTRTIAAFVATVSMVAAVRAQVPATVPPPASAHPRVDIMAGITSITLRKLPEDSEVGGLPAGALISAGYFWTPHLLTRIEFASQAESWNPDYAWEYVVRPVLGGGGELRTVQLKHDYVGSRRSVAQLFQFRTKRLQPYVGAGIGREEQSVRDVRFEWSRVLQPGETPPPGAKTIDEFPTQFPAPATSQYTTAFAEAGLKAFVSRRVYLSVDWKFSNGDHVPVTVAFGVELF